MTVRWGDKSWKKTASAECKTRSELRKLETKLAKTCGEADRHHIKSKIKSTRQNLRDHVHTLYTAVGSPYRKTGSGYVKRRSGC